MRCSLPIGIRSCRTFNVTLNSASVFSAIDTIRCPNPPPGTLDIKKNPRTSSF